MKIKFLRDHLQHKKDEVLENHPNGEYLIMLGAAEAEVGKEKVEQKQATEKKEIKKPVTKK